MGNVSFSVEKTPLSPTHDRVNPSTQPEKWTQNGHKERA